MTSSGGDSDGVICEENNNFDEFNRKLYVRELIEPINIQTKETKMISIRECSVCVANSRWLVISVSLLIMATASAIGVANAADNNPGGNSQLNGANNDDLQVSARKKSKQQLIQCTVSVLCRLERQSNILDK